MVRGMFTPEEMTAPFAPTERRRRDPTIVEDEDPGFADEETTEAGARLLRSMKPVPTAPALGTS